MPQPNKMASWSVVAFVARGIGHLDRPEVRAEDREIQHDPDRRRRLFSEGPQSALVLVGFGVLGLSASAGLAMTGPAQRVGEARRRSKCDADHSRCNGVAVSPNSWAADWRDGRCGARLKRDCRPSHRLRQN
jgi:hypothetical protein